MFKRNDNDRSFVEGPAQAIQTEEIEMRSSPVQAIAAIGPSIIVRGDITGDEDLMIQGRIEGALDLPQNDLTVGPDGKVKADLKALNIEVQGEVVGDLHGTEKVVVKRSGKVSGNISAPRVVLEDGCRFKGAVDMEAAQEQGQRGVTAGKKAAVKNVTDKTKLSSAVIDDGSGAVVNVARASSSG